MANDLTAKNFDSEKVFLDIDSAGGDGSSAASRRRSRHLEFNSADILAVLGALTDATIAAGATGSHSAKLRRLTTDLAAVLAKLSADPATATGVAAVLAELQGKADLSETQPVSAASLPLPSGAATSAKQDTLLTELQGKADLAETQPVSLATLPALTAGAAIIGAALDGGPSAAGTDTYTSSADMSTAADIGPAPSAGQKSVLLQATISVGTAMEFTLQLETTPAAERRSFLLPANGTVIFVPRYPIKLGTEDKKWQGKASVPGEVRISTTTRSEA